MKSKEFKLLTGYTYAEFGSKYNVDRKLVRNQVIQGKCCLIRRGSNTPSTHKLYPTWRGMIRRCYSKTEPNYKAYGGRGIKVCWRWLNSFDNFLNDMGDRPEGLSIDRIDNDKGYSPDNCRWANNFIQAVNKRKQKSNTSGATGVHWNKKNKNWMARITVLGKRRILGHFKSKEEAIEARRKAEIERDETI